MSEKRVRPKLLIASIAAASSFLPTAKASLIIDAGWDLFVTIPSQTRFMGQYWMGVPIGPYDFGGTIGIRDVGIADTIIHRPQAAEVAAYGQSDTIPIEIAWLQLKSVDVFDPDGPGPAPLDHYYITVGGPGGGSASINFDHEPGLSPHGWFSSSFDINWALRIGDVNGPILTTGTEGPFQIDSAFWNHTKTPPYGGIPLIKGVNYMLNDVDTSADFHLAFGPNGEGGGDPGEIPGASPPCYPPGSPIFSSPWYTHLVNSGYDPSKHGITECPEPLSLLLLALSGSVMVRRGR